MNIASSLRRISEEIKKQTQCKNNLPYTDALIKLLKILDPHEKILIAKYFLSLEWNIGSIKVLNLLQECKILSATGYMLKQTDEEHIQLILNDLLETQFELLANITTSCYYDMINSAKLTTTLEECFIRVFNDLDSNPNSLTVNYFVKLMPLVEEDVIIMLRLLHIKVYLSQGRSSLKTAISNLHTWREPIPKDTFLEQLLTEITSNQQESLNCIFKKSLESEFRGWKQYTALLHLLSDNNDSDYSTAIKRHLKDLFKQFVQQKNEKLFYIILLTARTVFTNENRNNSLNLDAYTQWYKQTIGEMSYTVATDDFKYVMNCLTRLLNLEEEPTYLEIHKNTAITAPPMCNQLVLSYKKACRRRFAVLKNDTDEDFMVESFKLENSIIIDD